MMTILYLLAATSPDNNSISMTGLLFLALLGVLYFLPAILAHRLRHRNAVAVFLLNMLLGWTLLGWVIALVWSVCNTEQTR